MFLTKDSLKLLTKGFTVSLLLNIMTATAVLAGNFSFTKIADTRSDFTNISNSTVINDSGTVAFIAAPDSTQQALYTSDGSAVTEVINSNGLPSLFGTSSSSGFSYSFVPLIDINNNGSVAFIANQIAPNGARDTNQKLFVAFNGGFCSRATVSNSARYGGESISAIALNNRDEVAYLGKTGGVAFPKSDRIVLTSTNQPDVMIATTASSTSNAMFSSITDVANNDTSSAFFTATEQSTGTTGIFTSLGGEVTAIEETPASGLAVNDNGDIALSSGDAIVLLDHSSGFVTTIADTNSLFESLNTPAINNNEQVVFLATLISGDKGIFTGSDPVADKVIATGDSLEGSTVEDLNFLRSGLNNKGQVVFFAQLADGTRGIFLAEPSQ